MSLVLYCGVHRDCTIVNMHNKLSQLRDAIARHDHKTIISLCKSLSRQQASYIAIKYQAYFGELFFQLVAFHIEALDICLSMARPLLMALP